MSRLLAGLLGLAPKLVFAVSPMMLGPRDDAGPLAVLIDLCSRVPEWVWGGLAVWLIFGLLFGKKGK
jgi:hypothetical protein